MDLPNTYHKYDEEHLDGARLEVGVVDGVRPPVVKGLLERHPRPPPQDPLRLSERESARE